MVDPRRLGVERVHGDDNPVSLDPDDAEAHLEHLLVADLGRAPSF
jgi:hypothetical protein